MKPSRFAFIDVDHTLTRHSTVRRLAYLGVRTGLFPISAVLSLPIYYSCYRMGIMPEKKLDRHFPFVSGKSRQELQDLGMRTYNQWIQNDVYPDGINLIQSLQSNGTRVILASSSLDILVEPLAKYLNVKDVISCSLEYEDNRSTGNIIGFPAFGDVKKRFVLEFLKQQNGSPEESSFYTDSIIDRPLLETVAHPIAVNPDPRLYWLSKKRGWPIIRFR